MRLNENTRTPERNRPISAMVTSINGMPNNAYIRHAIRPSFVLGTICP